MANNGSSPNADVLKHSVTRDDYATNPYSGYGSVWHMLFPGLVGTIGDLPPYWSPLRDRVLRTTPMRESMWASAVNIAITKLSTLDWRLDGRRLNYWQELLLAADHNQSFVSFEEKQAKDFLLTDNGNFFEIIRTNNARGARIIGLEHLSSWRCTRTGDPDIPVLYRDRQGGWHEMKDYQIVMMCDQPDVDYFYYDVGFSAASRAFNAIMKLSALEQYVYEKISGKRPLAIYLVNANIRERQLQDAVDTQVEKSNEKGYVQYMGAVIIPNLDPAAAPAVARIDLAGLPDGFDPEKERREAKLTYADAIGLDPLELDPELATRGKSLGTGAQAQVLDDKASGKGIITFRKKQAHLLNERVLPERVVFSFYETDLVDMGRRADITKARFSAMRDAVGNGIAPPILSPEQAMNVLSDWDEIPKEFLQQDLTVSDTLRDQEKPKTSGDTPNEAQTVGGVVVEASWNNRDLRLNEKAYNDLTNIAEKWAHDNHLPNYWMLSDDELIGIYLKINPMEKTSKRKVAELVKQESDNAKALFEKLIAEHPEEKKAMAKGNWFTHLTRKDVESAAKEISVNLPPIKISLPEQKAPIINVTVPEQMPPDIQVNIPPTVVNVQPAQVQVDVQPTKVTVPPAQVTVNVPEQQAPIVNNTVEKAKPETNATFKVIRDEFGRIKEIERNHD